MAEEDKKRLTPVLFRRISQAAFLLILLILFRKTDYYGADEINAAVNIFFRWDPLVAATAMLAAKTFIALLIPALIVVAITLILGRFFCGWMCPLGTCLDLSHKMIKPRFEGRERKFSRYKYYLLFIILVASIFGVQLVGYFDPFSIFVRGLTIAVDPALNAIVKYPVDVAYQSGPHWLTSITEPAYGFLRGTLLPFNPGYYNLVIPTLIILLAVFALEKIERRFWCRNLCPLGAMLGLISRASRLKIHPGKACKAQGCSTCIDICRTRAISDDGLVSPESCILCMDCVDGCEKGIVGFKFKRPKHPPAAVDLDRRVFTGAFAAGLFLPAILSIRSIEKRTDMYLLRPPGSLPGGEFLRRCVRCGECMKVCIKNGLQPASTNAGAEGLFSPILVPRLGYCEYNCHLCGQVCPTGAIRNLPLKKKHEFIIGKAFFNLNRCLPWAKATPCTVCEEMCPIPGKAIKMREETVKNPHGEEVTVMRPRVDENLCIGCGICEFYCPLPGESAVRVIKAVEEYGL